MAIRVTVWNEYLHEVQFPEVAEVYPKGIHGCIADFLKEAGMDVKTATLREPEHGLTQEVVDNTDVLIWWGHMLIRKCRMRLWIAFTIVFWKEWALSSFIPAMPLKSSGSCAERIAGN